MTKGQAVFDKPGSATCAVRLARVSDLDRIVDLLLALQDHLEESNPDLWRLTPEGRSNLKGQLAARLQADDGRALVAEVGEHGVVGVAFGRVVTNKRYSPDRAGMIDQVIVQADHRRHGIGSSLVAELCRFFREQGVEDLTLRYATGNEEAAHFWTHLGFSPRIVTAGASLDAVELRSSQAQEL